MLHEPPQAARKVVESREVHPTRMGPTPAPTQILSSRSLRIGLGWGRRVSPETRHKTRQPETGNSEPETDLLCAPFLQCRLACAGCGQHFIKGCFPAQFLQQ